MRKVIPGAVVGFLQCIIISSRGAETPANTGADGQPAIQLEEPPMQLWDGGVGQGFRSTVETLTVEAGAGAGFAVLGADQAHDLALLSLAYGHMLGHTVGQGRFYRGNFEFRVELFSGAQFAPSSEWVVGLAPHIRYNLATGTRIVPFIDAGAGVTATSIGPPDLSNIFEFNLQACGGIRWFFRDNVALTVEARYLHMSCAGISRPNLGLNTALGMLGLSWGF
jgi:hypothetical protein